MKKYLYNTAAFIICGTLCFSAVTKILNWSYTVDIIEKMLLDKSLGQIFSVLIILLELMLAISIYDSRYWKYTGYVSAFIFFIFGTIALWGKSAGRITQCPCFGKFLGGAIGIKLIIRNVILIIWSLILASHKNIVSTEKIEL